MTERSRVHAVLADILVTTLAATAAACGGTTADGPSSSSSSGSSSGGGESPSPSSSGGESPSPDARQCTSLRPFPRNVRPGPSIDYLEWRTEEAFFKTTPSPGIDDFKPTSEVLSGAPCAGASDKDACNGKLAGLRLLPLERDACYAKYGSLGSSCRTSYFVYTHGDSVQSVVTNEEVRTLLAPIDTPEEAAWALRALGGLEYACDPFVTNDATVREVAAGYEFVLQKNCDQSGLRYTFVVDAQGRVTETDRRPSPKGPGMCVSAGRRPEGFQPSTPLTADALGRYFATMAELEAVSIVAFRRLHRELANLGAPKKLLRRLRSAARDEIRHTRTMRELARRFGAVVAKPCVAPATQQRSAFEIALENAREGCVRETFGALLAGYQALRAEDPVVRDAMGTIAAEETDHAALSWDLARWLDRRLSEKERAAIRAARAAAIGELATEVAAPIDPLLGSSVGLPSAAVSSRLLDEAANRLLAA